MGRRKNAKPQANVGRVEDREPLPEEADAKDPEFDLDKWEETNAEPARPRKKRRPNPQAQQRALAPEGGVFRRLETAPQQWVFAELRLHALSPDAAADLLAATELSLAFPAAEEDAMAADVRVYADSGAFADLLAELSLPSIEAATALAGALPSAVALGPLTPASGAEPTTLLCPVGVSTQAMERGAAGWAEDARRGNAALLRLLRCLLPAAQAAALDPEREFEGDDDEELARSPLCSPRSRGAAAGGAFSPSAGAAGAAEAAAQASFDAAEIYAAVKPAGREPELAAPLPALRPTLRGYQRRAAQWMIGRERGEFPGAESRSSLHPLWREVRCLGAGAASFFINAYSGLLSTQAFPAPPPPRGGIASDEMGLGKTVELLALIVGNPYTGPAPDFLKVKAPPGRPRGERVDCVCGAAADDPAAGDVFYDGMWVQCAACEAWLHGACVGLKRAPKGDYTCQPCLRARAAAAVAQPCGTTLVVCPSPILAQWREEIGRHVIADALKIFVYEGQMQPGQRGKLPLVTASDLAAADIVLTTYDVLRKDLYHDADPEGEEEGGGRALRRGRRYEIIPTPLTRLKFWRVAIDEAQMVESSTAKAAAMALKLQTEHRWCVSGTPLSRGLEDLQGLMAFLQAEPYATRAWWRRVIQLPYESGSAAARRRLLHLLRPAAGGLLWRSAKADVKDELGIPPQHHHLSTLALSAIERHFYSRQHADCVGAARTALSASTLAAAQAAAAAMLAAEASATQTAAIFEDRPLTQREEHKLLHPVLRLRQACVHPQVGAGGIRALSHSRSPMTMAEVLDTLLAKARVEAEDAQRALLAALNGLAGLFLLQGLPVDAVRAYREVLSIVESNKGQVRADALQQLHTLHNLAEALAGPVAGNPAVPRTLRDGELHAAAAALREEYLAEHVARLTAAERELADVRAGAAKAAAEFEAVAGRAQAPALVAGWWVDTIGLLQRHTPEGGDAVARHIKGQLLEEEGDRFRMQTLRNAAALHRRFRDLTGLHMVLLERLKETEEARGAALGELETLTAAVAAPTPELVALAASCVRCRAVTAVSGRVCRHCRLDEKFTGWEVRAFDLVASTMAAGEEGALNVEAAAQREYAQGLRRAGRGGLGEESGPGAAAGLGDRRAGISRTDVIHRPSQAEQALRLLAGQLRSMRVPPDVVPRRDLLAAAAAAHLAALEASRKEFTKARAVALAQRQKLYALDELEMCATRLQLRAEGEAVMPGEELYKIHEAEVPVKSTELSADKAVAQAELRRTLGTLRYLTGLKAEQEARRAAGGSPRKARAAGEGAEEEVKADPCPICQDPLGKELCMLPCGHRLCCRCQLALAEQLPAATPAASKRIGCPTCRARVLLSEIAYIDASKEEEAEGDVKMEEAGASGGGSGSGGGGAAVVPLDYSALPGERGMRVRGSYGTKLETVVRRLMAIARADADARALVFSSWKDALELASHALTANGLPHLYPKAGGKKFDAALSQFRGGGPGAAAPRILLLLIKQGGNGLNLQQAQHVVFLEPLLDPAEEAQAVGRVDRIGQTRPTHVHRFVVADSVEENVHRLGRHRAAAMDMASAAVRRGKTEHGALTLRDVAAMLAGGGGQPEVEETHLELQ